MGHRQAVDVIRKLRDPIRMRVVSVILKSSGKCLHVELEEKHEVLVLCVRRFFNICMLVIVHIQPIMSLYFKYPVDVRSEALLFECRLF